MRRGFSLRSAARKFLVHLRTVQRWVQRAVGRRLDRVDWTDQPGGCRRAVHRVPTSMEDRILALRRELKERSALGEFGAVAIHRTLIEQKCEHIPCVRTIGRILERRGALDGQRRVRRVPPPKGWYLPAVASGQAELDSFDIVDGLVIRGGLDVQVLNGVSLHGGLCVSWPESRMTAKMAAKRLLKHWRRFGLPSYAQFDNDTIFQGAHQWADSFGRVTRLCLSLGIVPVFAPPRETGFQAAIENYNGRWQAKVWSRFEHADREALRQRSAAFVAAALQRAAVRRESAPPRRPFPKRWTLNLHSPLQGVVIYLRRTDHTGAVHLLGHRFHVSALWLHRLVRAEVHLSDRRIRFYALRRRQPDQQPLLKEVPYAPPTKRFLE